MDWAVALPALGSVMSSTWLSSLNVEETMKKINRRNITSMSDVMLMVGDLLFDGAPNAWLMFVSDFDFPLHSSTNG